MKTTAAVATLTGLIASASAQTSYFGLISVRSASPIHYQSVSASGQSLWLNKPTASYCPENVDECPAGNTTTFAGGDGSLSMGVVVPGGQQVYIEADTGRVKYTQAHSAAVPEDAVRTGWNLSEGESFGNLANENGGFLACPCDDDDSWKVFVALDGLKFGDDCLGFDALSGNATSAGAWQYS
ncbi:hypothetical protein Q7P37_010026 [Cladosporium fusiforme]